VDNPPYPFFLVCGNGATSGPNFTYAGTASGPYPGPFAESGTIAYNPTTVNDEYQFGEGPVTSFTTSFTIDSPNAVVTGSETLIPTGAPAVCWESAGGGGVDIGWCDGYGDNPGPPVCPIETDYTATIVTRSGTYQDRGTSSVELGESIGLGQYWNALLKDAFTSVPPALTLSNLAATVSGSTVNVSVDTSPAIVNVTLEEAGRKLAPDTTPVNGVASWTVTLPPGTHTLEVEGFNSPPGQPGKHSTVLTTSVVTSTPPPPPPPNPPTPPATSVSPPSSPAVATSPVAVVNVAEIKARLLDHLVPSAAKLAVLLKNGRYTYSFNTLSAGKITIDWYLVNEHVLVATGHASFSEAGLVKFRMKLTAHGRQILRATKSVKLIAKANYTPTGQPTIVATKGFTFRR
jgi:hypothetical protein